MNRYIVIFLIISLGLGSVLFIATDNIILSVGVFAVSIIFSILVCVPKLKKFNKVIERYHECYHFINNYLISLSIKKSISGALENTTMSMGANFNTIYEKMEDMNEIDKIKNLESYFPFYSYTLFLQIIDLWQEEGGDILQMSNYLFSEIRYEEEYVTNITSLARRKYIECGTLWIICTSILILLRFSLNDFYDRIKSQSLFLICLAILAAFILVSIYLLIDKGTTIELKGYNKNEKII